MENRSGRALFVFLAAAMSGNQVRCSEGVATIRACAAVAELARLEVPILRAL